MLLVLGQNWDHVLLCKEVKGTGLHSTAYLRIKMDSLHAGYSVYIMPIEPCGMALDTQRLLSPFRQPRLYILGVLFAGAGRQ
jgi:hypothetical protein